MTTTPEAGAWRLAAGCAGALAVVCVLVVWRSLHLDGAWLLALRLTGGLAVLGLLAAIWTALRPWGTREVVLRVQAGDDGLTTERVPAPMPPQNGAQARRGLPVALAAVAPVLLVVVLAVPAEAGGGGAGPVSSGTTSTAEVTGPASPTEPGTSAPTQPGTASPTEPAPSPTSEPPAEPPPIEPPAEPPTTEPPGGPPSSECPDGGPPQPYTVVEGDSLWLIAERSFLGDGTVAEIDAAWRALYDRSADVIGGDPDLILPGQQLLACR